MYVLHKPYTTTTHDINCEQHRNCFPSVKVPKYICRAYSPYTARVPEMMWNAEVVAGKIGTVQIRFN